jgi:hypothetical protein
MNKLATIGTMACVCVAAWTTPALSQARTIDEHIEDVRDKYTLRRDITLETRLVMDKRQAKTFQSLKKKFDLEWDALNDTSLALVHEFSALHDTLTAESAAAIARQFFDLQRSRLAVQEKYFGLIAERVSPVVAVQFSQIHRRYDLEIQRSAYTPLAE